VSFLGLVWAKVLQLMHAQQTISGNIHNTLCSSHESLCLPLWLSAAGPDDDLE